MWFYIKSLLKLLFCLLVLTFIFYVFSVGAVILESRGRLIPILIGFVSIVSLVLIGEKVVNWFKRRK
jgi:hypothetical protein